MLLLEVRQDGLDTKFCQLPLEARMTREQFVIESQHVDAGDGLTLVSVQTGQSFLPGLPLLPSPQDCEDDV